MSTRDQAFISIERTDPIGDVPTKLSFRRNYFSSPSGARSGVFFDARESRLSTRPGLVTVGLDPAGKVTKVSVEGAFVMPLGEAVACGVVTLLDSGYATSRLRRGWRAFWRMVARGALRLACLS